MLANAHSPAAPDWRILSAQGSASAQLGEQTRAQGFYEAALKIRPNEPSLLSNLGLSYALSRNLDQAEQTLRLAADQPGADARVRANLALVLGLKGHFADAEAVLRRDMSPEEAANNVASLRKLAAQPNRLKTLSGAGCRARAERPRIAHILGPTRTLRHPAGRRIEPRGAFRTFPTHAPARGGRVRTRAPWPQSRQENAPVIVTR